MSNTEDHALSAMGSTFAERAAYRARIESGNSKAVKAADVEDKAIGDSESKARPRKAAARKKS